MVDNSYTYGVGGGMVYEKAKGSNRVLCQSVINLCCGDFTLELCLFSWNFLERFGHRDAVLLHLRAYPLGRRCDDDQRGDYGPGDDCYVVDHDLYGYGPGSSRGKIRFFVWLQ